MSKPSKPSNALQAVLDRQIAAQPATQEAPASPAAPARARRQARRTDQLDEPADPASHPRPSRAGKRLIGGHFPPAIAKHLRILAAEEGTSVQALLEEALDLLFVKKGKGPIGRG